MSIILQRHSWIPQPCYRRILCFVNIQLTVWNWWLAWLANLDIYRQYRLMPAFIRNKLWGAINFTYLTPPARRKKLLCILSLWPINSRSSDACSLFHSTLYPVLSDTVSWYSTVIPRLSLWKCALKTPKSLLCVLCSIWIQQKKGAIRKMIVQPCSTKTHYVCKKTSRPSTSISEILRKFYPSRVKCGEPCYGWVPLAYPLRKETQCRRWCHICQVYMSVTAFSTGRIFLWGSQPTEVSIDPC